MRDLLRALREVVGEEPPPSVSARSKATQKLAQRLRAKAGSAKPKEPEKAQTPKTLELASVPVEPPILRPGPAYWIDWPLLLPRNTLRHHLGPDGRPTAERARLQRQVAAVLVERARPVPADRQLVAVLCVGLPVSGKSSLLKGLGEDFVQVSVERIREHLPEYAAAVQQSARRAAQVVEEEAQEIGHLAIESARTSRRNLAVEASGVAPSLFEDLSARLRTNGYRLIAVLPETGDRSSYHRAEARGQQEGLWLEERTVERLVPVIRRNFLEICRLADDFVVFDTDAPLPRRVWERLGSEEAVHDPAFVHKFLELAGVSESVETSLALLRERAPSFEAEEVVVRALGGLLASRPLLGAPRFSHEQGLLLPPPSDGHLTTRFHSA